MTQENGLGWQVALGIFGFFFAGGLSLATGNEMMTSLTRGAIGMVGLFLIGYLIRVALRLFVGTVDEQADALGSNIDLTVGEFKPLPLQELPTAQEAEDDFFPLFGAGNKAEEALRNIDPQKLAEALRHLDD